MTFTIETSVHWSAFLFGFSVQPKEYWQREVGIAFWPFIITIVAEGK